MSNVTATTLYDLLDRYDNLHDPQPSINRKESIWGVTISFMVLGWMCVLSRLYTRVLITRSPGWDDVCVIIALLSTSLGSICICLLPQYGMGQHILLIPLEHAVKYFEIFYIANASYCLSTTAIKLSLLLQYLRIFDRRSAAGKFCIGVAIFTALWGLANSILAWVPCVPVHMYWDRTMTSEQNCFAYGSLDPDIFSGTYESHTAINMALDLIVLAIPMPLYFNGGTDWKTRIALGAVFFMGGIVNFVSIWRLVTIVQHKATTYPTFDPTWYGPISIVLAAVEVDLAMVCASVPVFWPVLRDNLGKILVTKEVAITMEQRLGSVDEELELQSEVGSETSLAAAGGRTGTMRSTRRGSASGHLPRHHASKEGHYQDSFVRGQVDPLRTWGGATTTVEGGVAKKEERTGRPDKI